MCKTVKITKSEFLQMFEKSKSQLFKSEFQALNCFKKPSWQALNILNYKVNITFVRLQ